MLVIRQAQMQAFARAVQEQFERKVLAHLRANFSSSVAGYSDQDMLRIISSAVGKAQRYGISLQSDVVRFIEYLFLWDVEFDSASEWEWAAQILQSQHLTGTEKMNRIDAVDQFTRRCTVRRSLDDQITEGSRSD
jgi:hypothetical protein